MRHLLEQKGRYSFSGEYSVRVLQVGHLTFLILVAIIKDVAFQSFEGNDHNSRDFKKRGQSMQLAKTDPKLQAFIEKNLTFVFLCGLIMFANNFKDLQH